MSEPSYPIYAAIDLGSNSFHMLIVRSVEGSVQTIGKIKRKVRLAAGLQENGELDEAAMARGLDCLSLFAERLQDLPRKNVRIVGTAALRIATNRDVFLEKAEAILGHRIDIISGEEEAKLIYVGVAHTSGTSITKLVIDIGGASTEIVAGERFEPKIVNSLNIGCVTYKQNYFINGEINHRNFEQAIKAAQMALSGKLQPYLSFGWQACLGASGTPQALQEILIASGESEMITLEKLLKIKQAAIDCGNIDNLILPGLLEERRPVFVSGLAILIAIFQALHINYMVVAGGALREGMIYSMIPCLQQHDIRQRTLLSFIGRYQLDKEHAYRVRDTALKLFDQLELHWSLDQHDSKAILEAAAVLHEVGLAIDFKSAARHGEYILSNTAIPGFSLAQRKLLISIVRNYKDDIDLMQINQQTMTSPILAGQLTRLLRLAVLLTMRRKDEVLPHVKAISHGLDDIHLKFDDNWLAQHPLMDSELSQEHTYQAKVKWQLTFE
ncbi:guanosine-5'-triphosphate,3'-diphosphate diphosphatase [Catenovulum maritimum]|uniref:Guanosine-3',5'-bis(Diphosphate) 3'-pyrophosphohydrolase n=1 Tax=Catenovulum maritimum TaxID=1513271 RepID=A0A0J8GU45_9ALTE|nr:guanosine-5'-triphosphate,3'-diphosphate diphosphatase [Catenovulum maritimum]KMT66262.1 guanosine-3',5'-bis(diphosphate) 3'-pyrophosphohydrolase [Catenovulum maritimum]